jgi:hypothetical protein
VNVYCDGSSSRAIVGARVGPCRLVADAFGQGAVRRHMVPSQLPLRDLEYEIAVRGAVTEIVI